MLASSERQMIIRPSTRVGKKWMAIFSDDTVTHFGAKGYTDYTRGASKAQREAYIRRHAHEDKSDPRSAAALSRHILWGESRNMDANIRAFKRRYSTALGHR